MNPTDTKAAKVEGSDLAEDGGLSISAQTKTPSSAEKRPAARPSDTESPARPPKIRPQGWAPYRDAPKRVEQRFRKQLDRAHREPQVAIKLYCVECMGYSESEPRGCTDRTCPLFAFNRRIFDQREFGSSE